MTSDDTLLPNSRISLWSFLAVCSAIVLSSVVERADRLNYTLKQEINISFASISFGLSVFFVAVYIGGPLKEIQRSFIEHFVSVVAAGIWCAAVALYFDGGGIIAATLQDGTKITYIPDANLYYATWGAFLSSVFLLGGSIQSGLQIDPLEASKRLITRFKMWFILFASSCVVLWMASEIFVEAKCKEIYATDEFCLNTVITLGLFSSAGFLSLIVLVLKMCHSYFQGRILQYIELAITFPISAGILVCMNYMTGLNGPGESVGNLYYFVWIAFDVSVYISIYCLDGYRTPVDVPSTKPVAEDPKNPSISEHKVEEYLKEEEVVVEKDDTPKEDNSNKAPENKEEDNKLTENYSIKIDVVDDVTETAPVETKDVNDTTTAEDEDANKTNPFKKEDVIETNTVEEKVVTETTIVDEKDVTKTTAVEGEDAAEHFIRKSLSAGGTITNTESAV